MSAPISAFSAARCARKAASRGDDSTSSTRRRAVARSSVACTPHRQRQKRTSGTLGPHWASVPSLTSSTEPGHHDWMRAATRPRIQHTDDQDGGRKLLWMLHRDLRDGPRISCPAKEPALRALCASTGSPGPIGVAVRRPLLTETSRARDAPVVAIGSTWRSSPCVTARRSLGG